MPQTVRVWSPEETGRLLEIGELTALAYLADGLVDAAHPYVPRLRDAGERAQHAQLLAMIDGEHGEGKIVGTITLVPPGSAFAELAQGDEFELRMLAVSPIERGRGIGASLTQAALDMAVANGATRIVLSTMESMHVAHRLYERMGFIRRPELDWTVVDHQDGSVRRINASGAANADAEGVRLLGYSWEPSH